MKLDLFTWIPASSAGMTILLFAAQLNAAGVCIVCPPGYDCPAGEAPVLGGVPGQILRRTTAGAEWVSVTSAVLAEPRGATGLIAMLADEMVTHLVHGNNPRLFNVTGLCVSWGTQDAHCMCQRYSLGSLNADRHHASEGALMRNFRGEIPRWPLVGGNPVCPIDCVSSCKSNIRYWIDFDHFL